MKRLCQKADMSGYFTNHSLCATAITRLFENNVVEQLIVALSCHTQCMHKCYLTSMKLIKPQHTPYKQHTWPGMAHDIDQVILACNQCQDHLLLHTKEPITMSFRR